jgi:hypothetical protein
MGQSRPGRASSKSGHVGYVTKSGSNSVHWRDRHASFRVDGDAVDVLALRRGHAVEGDQTRAPPGSRVEGKRHTSAEGGERGARCQPLNLRTGPSPMGFGPVGVVSLFCYISMNSVGWAILKKSLTCFKVKDPDHPDHTFGPPGDGSGMVRRTDTLLPMTARMRLRVTAGSCQTKLVRGRVNVLLTIFGDEFSRFGSK